MGATLADETKGLDGWTHEQCFWHDRRMSLHRRAYEIVARGGKFEEWLELADRLILPEEKSQQWDWRQQFWKTAQTAFGAGMSAKQAFPCCGDISPYPVGGPSVEVAPG
jgi:hypothetical protein